MIAAGRHSRFLQLAAQVAENSEQETKHGSLLVRGGKVLGSGHNSSRSRLQAMPGASNVTSLHSEVTTPPLLLLWKSVIVVLWFRANFALAAYFPCRCDRVLFSRLCPQVAAVKAVPWVLQGSR